MQELKNMERLNVNVTIRIKPYLGKLLSLHKEDITSVFVYGAAAGKDFDSRKQEITLGVVFEELGFKHLRESLHLVKEGIKRKIPAPLFLTLKHIKSSCDVFPLEFLEMQDTNLVVYGGDILSQIQIKREPLRLEVEGQIKGKLINIRQAYLEMGLKKKGIDILLKKSLNSLIPVFRGILKVSEFDKTPPKDRNNIVMNLGEKFNLDKKVFVSILRDEKDDNTILGKDALDYLARYIEEIKKLAVIVDTL